MIISAIASHINTAPWSILSHLSLVPHICVIESGQHWSWWWHVAFSVPSHYLNQCLVIVHWTLRNKLQWNFNQNTKIFILENTSKNSISETAAIFSWGISVNIWGRCVIFGTKVNDVDLTSILCHHYCLSTYGFLTPDSHLGVFTGKANIS